MVAVLSVMAFPAMAVDNEVNSGFGADYFADAPHPAFEDPSFVDAESLAGIEPSAGDESESQPEEENQPAALEGISIPSQEENQAAGTSGQ